MTYDVLTIGPARMDIFVKLPDSEVEEVCNIDRQKCTINLGFGDKIPIDKLEMEIGGNSGNHAVGVTRLGFKAAMIARIGAGYLDKLVLQRLQEEGVETKYVQALGEGFGLGLVLNYQEERTILSHYVGEECIFPNDEELSAQWMYLTSAGERFENLYSSAVDWAVSKNTRIAFNPSTRQIRFGDKLNYVYQNTEVLFLNKEEAQALLKNSTQEVLELGMGLKKLGVKLAIITDGPNGAYAFDDRDLLFQPIIDAPVIERTGAGDAFGSGFMAAYMQNLNIATCLKWGATNSASVLGFIGPQRGLLTRSKMKELI